MKEEIFDTEHAVMWTAHQKQVISELNSVLLIMMSSTMASFMNGFLYLMTLTIHVHSSAKQKEPAWLLN